MTLRKKCFMVSQGHVEVYTDHGSNANLLMVSTSQDALTSEYDTFCRYVCTEGGNLQILCHQIGTLNYCVVVSAPNENKEEENFRLKQLNESTDETLNEINNELQLNKTCNEEEELLDLQVRETSAALFRQLCLLHDLVCFRIQLQNLSSHSMTFNQSEAFRLLSPLVRAMKRMTYTHQNILVQGIEFVELGPLLRDEVTEAIYRVIRNQRHILHAVLFVGTKLATVCSRARSWVLSPRDLLCLLIYTESVFNVSKVEGEYTEEQQKQYSDIPQNDMNSSFDSPNEVSSLGTPPAESLAESFHSMKSNQNNMDNMEERNDEKDNENTQEIPSTKPQESSDTVFDSLFLHHPTQNLVKFGVFLKYDKKSNITLLLIYDPMFERATPTTETQNLESASKDERAYFQKELLRAQQSIFNGLNNFISFLKIKAHSHITMIHYLNYCPGMIHFVLVDRIRNRVIAPRIVPLEAYAKSPSDPEIEAKSKLQVEFLKKKVWEMCYLSQQYRDQGYTEVGICGLGVQYWFKEWIEDENYNELKFTEKNILCEADGSANARAHFELYTMYLPFVSTQAIARYNKLLTCVLLDRPFDRVPAPSQSSSFYGSLPGRSNSFSV